MSHRVTTETDFKDKALVVQALKNAHYSFTERGNSLFVTSGPMTNATIDLTTGTVSGDTDYKHSDSLDSLGALKQAYGEAKYRQELAKQGHSVLDRQVDARTGDIILRCKASFG